MTVVSIVLALVALGVAGLALRRTDVVERRAKEWLGDPARRPGPASVPAGTTVPAGTAATPSGDAATIAELQRRIGRLEGAGATSGLNRVAVVRYDAFEDLGGRLSFSAAVVDDAGRGLVLTAIHGRSETRSYLKQVPVTADSGQRELSPEEQQALAQALRGPTS